MPLSSSSRTKPSRLFCGSVVNTIDTSAWPFFSTSCRRAMSTGHELLELQPVDLLQSELAVQPLAALGRAVQRQVLRLALEVRDLREPSLSAVSLVTATSFELTNGVGGSAVRFFFAKPAFASS